MCNDVRTFVGHALGGIGMKLGRRFSWASAAAVFAVVLLLAPQAMAATVTNGGFETGDFTGWTVTPQSESNGTWTVATGTSTPLSEHEIAAPPCGTHAAIFDENDESSAVMYQDLSLAADATNTLSFTHYYVNYATTGEGDVTPVWNSPDTLDYTFDGTNQQYRVDIMKTSADPFSVDPSDILKTVFQTEPGDAASLDPTPVTVDLSAFAGQTVRLRFAAVDNWDYLNVGVDCVALTSTPLSTTTSSSTTSTTAVPSTTTTTAPVAVEAAPAFTG
jgi:hypothetical protein